MFSIGLTGGIGSGKSTVAEAFRLLGAAIIDADVIARTLVQPGSKALQEIVAHFGEGVVDTQGVLRRSILRKAIYHDQQAKAALESILHPKISQQIQTELAKQTAAYTMVVIPLLIETNMLFLVQRVLVVDAPEAVQIQRVMSRDQLPAREIEAILDNQLTRAQRLQHADDVVYNGGSLEMLRHQVANLHDFYLSLASPHG